jgi:uncharacterized protein YecT (DUF1311 family)
MCLKLSLLLACSLVLVPSGLRGQEADSTICEEAGTDLEMQTCLSAALQSAEDNLAGALEALRPYASNPAMFDSAQAVWVHYRDMACSMAGEYEGDTLFPVAVLTCRLQLTHSRMRHVLSDWDRAIAAEVRAAEKRANELAGCYQLELNPILDKDTLVVPVRVELKSEPYTGLGYHRLFFFCTDMPLALPRAQENPIWKPVGEDSVLIDLYPTHSFVWYELVAEVHGDSFVGEIRRLNWRASPDPEEWPLPVATVDARQPVRAQRIECKRNEDTGAA